MKSSYFTLKIKTKEFKIYIKHIFEELRNKKILIYGTDEAFLELNGQYNFTEHLNIVAIASKKFKNNKQFLCNIKTISPNDIKYSDFDSILVVNENYEAIEKFLVNNLCIQNDKIKILLKQDIKDERENLNYLCKLNFEKTFPELIKKLKNKKIVIYGYGCFFQVIKKYFDISELNIIAVADNKFANNRKPDFIEYQTCAPENIKALNPDYILIATKSWIDIMEFLYTKILRTSDIKIMPLVKRPFFNIIKDI